VERGDMRNADRVSFLIIIGICVYFWIESRTFGKYGVLFPQVIIIILGLLACVLLAVSFFEPKKIKVFGEESIKYTFILLIVFLIIAWIAFIPYIGFVVTSVIFISIINVLVDKKHRKLGSIATKVLIIAVIVGAFYLFFSKLLLVSFPKGVLF
jgi:hypothetical protein